MFNELNKILFNDFFQEFRRIDKVPQNEVHQITGEDMALELVSKEFNHLAAILHVYTGGLIFMK